MNMSEHENNIETKNKTMSKSITLHIPSGVVEPNDIVVIINNRTNLTKARILNSNPTFCTIVFNWANGEYGNFTFHHQTGNVPNHIGLHANHSDHQESLFKDIGRITGGTLQIEDSWKNLGNGELNFETGLFFKIKSSILNGRIGGADDLEALLKVIASENKYYSPSNPLKKIMDSLKNL